MSVPVSQVWPPVIPAQMIPRQVWSTPTALAIPGVGKAVHLWRLAARLNMGAWRGRQQLPTPRILTQPDPLTPGTTEFLGNHIQDWLLEGNAMHLVTVTSEVTGLPLSVKWYPAHMWHAESRDNLTIDRWWLNGHEVATSKVVHVRRLYDPAAPYRGVGIVEQHVRALDKTALQDESERRSLQSGAVPSVAVIAPQTELDDDEIKQAGDQWDAAFSGPGRRPGIFPAGTTITPLSWSATDAQAIEARKMSLIDVANITGLDPYWLGGAAPSHTYKSPGPMWLTLLNTTHEVLLQLLEDAWGAAWLPRGQELRFDRTEMTRDSVESELAWIKTAIDAKLMTPFEGRVRLGWDPEGYDDETPTKQPVPPALAAFAGAPAEPDDQADAATDDTEGEPTDE